ncbi:hypothetical protein D0T56_13785 [Dysgonomonas sp. 520]|nr:hypothetical protein [Dysgonomonas sp. 520]NDW10719.1 hypothetical protein [Dysgonomonas sp. 520]
MKNLLIILSLLLVVETVSAQEIVMQETALSDQVFGNQVESDEPLPMNDLDIEFGYALYQADINVESDEAILEVENIRDYAVVYLDEELQGVVNDNNKTLALNVDSGKYSLRIYVENIGRITYGPEILDNSKGLFGDINIDGESIDNWIITELKIRNVDLGDLNFSEQKEVNLPCFHKGYVELDEPKDMYLDISGWGMGEVWINAQYQGSYWEEEKQQSIQVPASVLKKGKNELIVFELKNNKQNTMRFSEEPIFK